MVVDSSALVAILRKEPEAARFTRAILRDPVRLMSAANLLEAGIIIDNQSGLSAGRRLDAFVERFATRVASFDRRLIAAAKDIINQRAGLAQPDDLAASQRQFFETATWQESQARLASLLQRGLQQYGDFELRLGEHLATP